MGKIVTVSSKYVCFIRRDRDDDKKKCKQVRNNRDSAEKRNMFKHYLS